MGYCVPLFLLGHNALWFWHWSGGRVLLNVDRQHLGGGRQPVLGCLDQETANDNALRLSVRELYLECCRWVRLQLERRHVAGCATDENRGYLAAFVCNCSEFVPEVAQQTGSILLAHKLFCQKAWESRKAYRGKTSAAPVAIPNS